MSVVQALAAVVRRWWIAVLVAGVAVVAVFALSPAATRPTPQFEATNILAATSSGQSSSTAPTNLDEAVLETTVGAVPRLAAHILGDTGDPTVLAAQVAVSDSPTVGTLTIKATGADGGRAARVANAFATALNQQLSQTAVASYESQVTAVNQRLTDLQAQINQYDGKTDPVSQAKLGGAEDQYRLAYDQFQQLAAQGPPASTFSVLQTAVPVPVAGAHPPRSRKLKSLVAGVVGLLIGSGVAIALELLRPRLQTRVEAESDFVSVVLAEIPLLSRIQRHRRRKRDDLPHVAAFREAHRMLRSSLSLAVDDTSRAQVILVTSSQAGEGKSTTVANLALALADAGQKVLILSCDFRSPQIHLAFGLEPARGLTDLLAAGGDHGTALADLVRPTGVPGLSLVDAGTRVDSPAELISSRAVGLMEEARALADVVLVDTAPLLLVSDTSELLPAVDGVVLVAWLGWTTRDEARRSAELLRRSSVPLLGVTLIGVKGRNSTYYGYPSSTSRWSGRPGRRRRGTAVPIGDGEIGLSSPPPPPPAGPRTVGLDGWGGPVSTGRLEAPASTPSPVAPAVLTVHEWPPPPPEPLSEPPLATETETAAESKPEAQSGPEVESGPDVKFPLAAESPPAAESGPVVGDEVPAGHSLSARFDGNGTGSWFAGVLDGWPSTGALVVLAALGGALAGCHPTGTPVLDPLYTAIFAAGVTLAAAVAARSALLVLAAGAVVLSRGAVLAPAAVALLVAFSSVFGSRLRRVPGALVGALAVQAVLRWPSVGVHGLTAAAALALVAPCAVSALRHTARRPRRWLLRATGALAGAAVVVSVPVVASAVVARRDINAGVEATTGVLDSVGNGGGISAAAQLRTASVDFSRAAGRTGAWWTAGGRLVPIVAQQREVLVRAPAVAGAVTGAVGRQSGRLRTVPQYSSGGIDLAGVAALTGPLDAVDRNLGLAARQLASVRSRWLVGPLQTRLSLLDADVTRAAARADTASQVVRAAPALLGGDGVRHYLAVIMTPAEGRGLDGLIESWAELTADRGRITMTRSGNISTLNDVPTGSRHIAGPADYVARYSAFAPQNFFQDLTYSPDMPTVTQVAAAMYAQSGGDHIDGLLALDPDALAALLKLAGPVAIPQLGTLDAANASSVLVRGQYAALPSPTEQGVRHDYLQDALTRTVGQLTTGSLPGSQSLAAALGPVVGQGRLLFWSLHPADQPFLRRLDLGGAFPGAGGHDLLAVTTQNAANNKIDAYLQSSVSDRVSDPGDGRETATVTVTLHNSAPATGLSSEVLASYTGSGLPSGTNRTWLSIYSPLGMVGGDRDGVATPFTSTPELGVHAYSTWVDIPAGGTVTLTVALRGRIAPGHYDITVRRQPMVNPEPIAVTLSNVDGSGGTWMVGDNAVAAHSFPAAS